MKIRFVYYEGTVMEPRVLESYYPFPFQNILFLVYIRGVTNSPVFI